MPILEPGPWFAKYLADRGIAETTATNANWKLLQPDVGEAFNPELAALVGKVQATRIEAAIRIQYADGAVRLRCYRPPLTLRADADPLIEKSVLYERWDSRQAHQRRLDVGGCPINETPERHPDRWRHLDDLPSSIRKQVQAAKFLSPEGSGVHIFRHGRPSGENMLYVVEGETRALLLHQHGMWAAAIGGASMWHQRGSKDLHPDLAADVAAAAQVMVIFDSDVDRNDDLQVQLNHLIDAIDRVSPGKTSVAYVDGEDHAGLDDVLAKVPQDQRRKRVQELWTSPSDLDAAFDEVQDLIRDPEILAKYYVNRFLRRCWGRPLFGRTDKETKTFIRGYEDYRKALDSDLPHPSPWVPAGRGAGQMLQDLLAIYAGVPYRTAFRADGSAALFKVGENNLCTPIADDTHLVAALMEWGSKIVQGQISADTAAALSRTWKLLSDKTISMPTILRFAGDQTPATHEIPRPTAGATTAWDEFLGRLSCVDTFLAWVWSVVELKHQGRQALYLRGAAGQDGKTVVAEVLAGLLGPLAVQVSDWKETNPHTTAAFSGKRLAIKDDLKNPFLAKLALFRTVVSGGTLTLNPKNKDHRSERVYLRVLVTSNTLPVLSSDGEAERSRFLIVDVAPSATKSDPTWPQRLKAELPALLGRARDAYARLCPSDGDIKTTAPTKQLLDEAQGLENDRWARLNEAIVLNPNARVTPGELDDLLERLRVHGQMEKGDAHAWLRGRPGVGRGNVKRDGRQLYGWHGFHIVGLPAERFVAEPPEMPQQPSTN